MSKIAVSAFYKFVTLADIAALRPVLDELTARLWNTKILAFGANPPQVFWCREPISGIGDFAGKKVRVFNQTLSDFVIGLGGTTVNIPFVDVIPALQRGVASCGITSATSANTGKWPEVTTHILPLAVSGAVQAHVVNLAWWNKLGAEQKAALEAQFADMENKLWEVAAKTNGVALACSTGGTCDDKLYRSYNLKLVKLADGDFDRLKTITQNVILGDWANRCERVYPGCTKVWNDTVGAARGMAVPAK